MSEMLHHDDDIVDVADVTFEDATEDIAKALADPARATRVAAIRAEMAQEDRSTR